MSKKMMIAAVTACLALGSAPAFAGRLVDGALGAGAGAVVGGPVGAVAGGAIGYVAGPGIDCGMHGGCRHHRPYHHRHYYERRD